MGIYYNKELYDILIPVNEAYVGKTKELKDIENQLGVIRRKFNKRYFNDVNQDDDTLELNRMFEETFGFGCFALHIAPTSVINAYTIPIGLKTDSGYNASKAIVNKKGFKYKKSANYTCILTVTSGLMFNEKFSDGEVLAIMLHELGHNFAEIVSNTVSANSIGLQSLSIYYGLLFIISGHIKEGLQYLMANNNFERWCESADKFIAKKIKGFHYIRLFINGVTGALTDVISNISYLLNKLSLGLLALPNHIIQKMNQALTKPTAYSNERIADNFATFYGYGPELTTALGKMSTGEIGVAAQDALNNVPLLNNIITLTNMPAEIIVSAFDEHPQYSERLQDQIRMLKRELNKDNIDPKMKKEIQKNIDDIEEAKDRFITKKESITEDPHTIQKIYWAWLLKISDGDFKHYVLGRKTADQYDAAVNNDE